MGINTVIRAVGSVTDEELAEANARIAEWVGHGLWSEGDVDGARQPLERDPCEVDTLEVSTWWRYYGPHCERGPWPQIYRCIRAVQAWLPQCRVYYGGDSSDYVDEVTDDFLCEMWDHYNGPEGDAYRRALVVT